MLLAVCDDGAGNAGIDARYMLEEGSGSRVDLDTGEVDAGYHNAIKHGSQFFLIYVMLVQPYADGFRVDLHSSARGSCKRRAIEMVPRCVASRLGNSARAASEAE